MTRLFFVFLITVVAFIVARYSWNRAPDFDCSPAGLTQAVSSFTALAEQRPRQARQELTKLAKRTGLHEGDISLERLIDIWALEGNPPSTRVCRRLRESLARLR